MAPPYARTRILTLPNPGPPLQTLATTLIPFSSFSPTAITDVVLPAGTDVYLDAPAEVRNLTINGTFRIGGNHTLHSFANCVGTGSGRLISLSDPRVTWTMFVGDETLMVGGGMSPIASDIGWWMMDNFQCTLQGGSKTSWTTLTGAVSAGAFTITVNDSGNWAIGDAIAIAPMELVTVPLHWDHFDERVITQVNGTTLTLDAALTYPHPTQVVNGVTYTAEVMNLTRDVTFQGQLGQRSHFFIRSTQPQFFRECAFKDMGPRHFAPEVDVAPEIGRVQGRWSLHWHHAMNGSRGSLAEDCVVWRCGSWGFTAHMSDGVTFRRCIGHDTVEEPYRWDDFEPPPIDDVSITNDTLYENCIASRVRSPFRRGRVAGFSIQRGSGNAANGCRAFGIAGYDAGGAIWQEFSGEVWGFNGFICHNTDEHAHGIFNWKNDGRLHTLQNVVLFNTERDALFHGAYRNSFQFLNWAVRDGMIEIAALGQDTDPVQLWDGMALDMNGRNPYAIVFRGDAGAQLVVDFPRDMRNITMRGYTVAGCHFETAQFDFSLHRQDLRNVTFIESLPEFYLENDCHVGTEIRIQTSTGPNLLVTDVLSIKRADQAGTYVAAWNARVTVIAPF